MEDQSAIKGKIKYKKGMRQKNLIFWSKKRELQREEEERRSEEKKEEEEE